MPETQNTPPHAEITITVGGEKDALGFSNVQVKITGCQGCLREGMAHHLLASPFLKEFINKTVRRANELRAQKEN